MSTITQRLRDGGFGALAHRLRSSDRVRGAIAQPDVCLEADILAAAHGLPVGPRAASDGLSGAIDSSVPSSSVDPLQVAAESCVPRSAASSTPEACHVQAPLEAPWAGVSQREEAVAAPFAVRLGLHGQESANSSVGRGTCSRCILFVSRLAVIERKLAELDKELRPAHGDTRELQQAHSAQRQGPLPPRQRL